jgi:GNAT superfamily N-acetyltransferase
VDIQRYSPEKLPDLVKYQILSFMRIEWTEGFIGRWRGRRWINWPEFNPVHFVMMDQGFVVAHAESLWRDWQHNGVSYRVYGISGVFVFPDYQREGYGKQLIQAITDDCMNQPEADVGMLWCDPKLRDFYVKCGWEPMDNTITLLGDTLEDAEEHHEEILFMRFFSQRAQSRRQRFEGDRLYFGWTTW